VTPFHVWFGAGAVQGLNAGAELETQHMTIYSVVLATAVVVIVVVPFFDHNFVNCKATLILEREKIYEIKYNISLIHSDNEIDKSINVSKIANNISTMGDNSTAAGCHNSRLITVLVQHARSLK